MLKSPTWQPINLEGFSKPKVLGGCRGVVGWHPRDLALQHPGANGARGIPNVPNDIYFWVATILSANIYYIDKSMHVCHHVCTWFCTFKICTCTTYQLSSTSITWNPASLLWKEQVSTGHPDQTPFSTTGSRLSCDFLLGGGSARPLVVERNGLCMLLWCIVFCAEEWYVQKNTKWLWIHSSQLSLQNCQVIQFGFQLVVNDVVSVNV